MSSSAKSSIGSRTFSSIKDVLDAEEQMQGTPAERRGETCESTLLLHGLVSATLFGEVLYLSVAPA